MITVRDNGYGYTATEKLNTGDHCIVCRDGKKELAICSQESVEDTCTGCMIYRPGRKCISIGCGDGHFILVNVDELLEDL